MTDNSYINELLEELRQISEKHYVQSQLIWHQTISDTRASKQTFLGFMNELEKSNIITNEQKHRLRQKIYYQQLTA